MSKLSIGYDLLNAQTTSLMQLHREGSALAPRHRKLLAEISMLRLCYVLENLLETSVAKLLSGATYLDGSHPTRVIQLRSSRAALQAMSTYNRNKTRAVLKWNRVSEIKENVRFMMSSSEHALTALDKYGAIIDEMRRIRNRIAHNSSRCRSEFRPVVLKYYGAELNHISPGTLLLSARRVPCLMEAYLRGAAVIGRDVLRG